MRKNRKYYSVMVLDMVIGVTNLYQSPNPNRIIYNIIIHNIKVLQYTHTHVYSLFAKSLTLSVNTKIALCELHFVGKFISFEMNQNL